MDTRFLGTLLAAGVLLGGCSPPDREGAVMVTDPVVPDRANGWIADGGVESYDTETIFAYIDGHAEVYLAYGMKRCLSRRYRAPSGDGEIVVDLFEMASPADAFGVFSHDRKGESVEIGQGGVFRHGWLSFWQGPWYGSVYASDADEKSRDAVVAVADTVAGVLAPAGGIPPIVNRLPTDGLEPGSVCFLRSPQILNAHVFVGSDNPLGLGPEVEAVVGTYVLDQGSAHLVLVGYSNDREAAAVEARVRGAAGSATTGPEMLIGRHGVFLAAVVGAEPDGRAESLLAEALGDDT